MLPFLPPHRPEIRASMPALCGSRHDADTPIDVGDSAGEPPGKRRGQERRRETDIVDVDQFTDGRALTGFVQEKVKVLQTRRGPRLEWSRRDGVHADVLVAELIGQIPDCAL